MSATLRPASSADVAWLDAWLPTVAASVGYEPHQPAPPKRKAPPPSASERLLIERDGEPVGILIWRPHGTDAAIIELIATPPEHARRGLGMRAAALLEDRLRAKGVTAMYAPAPAVHGIAMYFWIRLGYRPLLRGEWPCERAGVAWLMRRIDP